LGVGLEVRSSFGTDCDSFFGSGFFDSSFFGVGLSSAGSSRELRSSPGSAVTAILLPT
jgi:hypothetical protein